MDLGADSWSIFKHFEPGLSWSDFDVLQAAASKALKPELGRALELVREWEEQLRPLGRTPSDIDWRKVRQLRLGREEDWSDWLAFLLEEAPTQLLQEFLPELPKTGVAQVDAEREVVAGEYRADVVLKAGRVRVSIEVKLDDAGLEKTFECCAALEEAVGGRWMHFILLPEDRRDEWDAVSSRRCDREHVLVGTRTWTALALALRRCLWRKDGSLAWRSWALPFCAAVEQQILDLPSKADLESCSTSRITLMLQAARLAQFLTDAKGEVDGRKR